MLSRSLRVLLVEDNPTDVLLVEVAFEEMAAFAPELTHADSLASAQQALDDDSFDVVLIDLNLPDGQGLGNFERLQEHAPQTPMIVLTGLDDEELAIEAIARGAADYLIKGATDAPLLERSTRYAIERKKNENDRLELARVQIARDEAEANNRAKDEFLATLSHELRTPLNAIMGWASLLKTGQLDEATSEQALDTIERNARVQAQLIEDLLDVSRIIAGNFRLEVAVVDLRAIVRAAADTMAPAISAKNIAFQLDAPAPVPVRGDAMRLQQVAWNLISNAVKFTPAGGDVQVKCACIADQAVLTISDSGQGIAPEFLPHVFERFRQADGSTTRRHGGLGLGLAIVRNVVKLHSGHVVARSDGHQRGATFEVSLPAAPAPIESGPDAPFDPCAESSPAWRSVHILAVDDRQDVRDVVRLTFEKRGAHVEVASSASEALRRIETSAPDLLISDIGMPETDGYGLIAALRERGLTMPAIALTGFARGGERARARQAGFQEFLAKPIDPDALCRAAAALLRLSRNAD